MECLRLRVKDVDFDLGQAVVRDGKGGKDRRTMLPRSVRRPLAGHLAPVRELYRVSLIPLGVTQLTDFLLARGRSGG